MLRIVDEDRRGTIPTVPISFIDPTARLGADVKVWHFARVLAHVRLESGVSIGGGTEVGFRSVVGSGSRISANCFLPSDSQVGRWVFVGPGCVFTDDKDPYVRSPADGPYRAQPPVVEEYANIGAHCTILPGVRIGHHALIGAGSVVAKDVEPYSVVRGEPAQDRYTMAMA
jgi:UDP-2-acetamido-3-amino-2,3-dideoxy-glucuronate N-acetyltransferase